jgi:hypothetical protein
MSLQASLLSHAGQAALIAAVQTSDPTTAQLLTNYALQAAELRSLLDQLADDLITNDLASAQARLHALLEPIYTYEQAHARFAAAQAAVTEALASATPLLNTITPTDLPQLHSNASAVAAAFDELAEASQALAALQTH